MTDYKSNLCAVCNFGDGTSSLVVLKEKDIKLDMLGIVLPNFEDLTNSTKSLLICVNCDKVLRFLFDFKSLCLENEDYLLNLKSDKKIDLLEVMQQKFDGNTDAKEICRICLKLTIQETSSGLDTIEVMLNQCVPELDFTLTTKILFCESCVNALEKHSKFLMQYNLRKLGKIQTGPVIKQELCDYRNSVSTATVPEADMIKQENIKQEKTEYSLQNQIHHSVSLDNLQDDKCKVLPRTDTGDWEKCPFCPFSTNVPFSLSKHLRIKHPDRPQFWCELCNFKCIRKFDFHCHMIGAHGVPVDYPYACEFCSHRNKRRDFLKKHIEINHALIKCSDCDFETRLKDKMEKHKTSHYEPETSWPYCPDCPFKSSSYKSVYKHMVKNSHGDSHICAQYLKQHYRILAEEKKIRKRLKAKAKNSKRNKEKSETVTDIVPEEKVKEKRGESRVVQCKICSLRFSTSSSVNRHIRVKHPDEAELRCSKCPFIALKKMDLRGHLLSCYLNA